MRAISLALPLTLALLATACNVDPAGKKNEAPASGNPAQQGSGAQTIASADAMASHDPQPGRPAPADPAPNPMMQLQVVLERLGFAPGVIDGKDGLSTRNALSGFQQAHDLPQTGKADDATRKALAQWANIPATRTVTVPDDFAAGPFAPVPHDPAEQAKLPTLGYASLDEKLAERFHTTPDVLHQLNGQPTPAPEAGPSPSPAPGTPQPAVFRAGQQIRVPNVGADAISGGLVDDQAWLATMRDLGVGTSQPKVDKVVVSKSKGTLLAYDENGKLVAAFTATMGSSHDPLPLGTWKIQGVSRNPQFHYNPDLFWDAKATDKKQTLPPGPNGPVGVVWIDLSKPHYGIHGTPEPQTIGRTESHGCVRLTNWDAARLAQMVHAGTVALFVA
jgi:lipoprotein-anchoring transpeptidase ErfK/SrfK